MNIIDKIKSIAKKKNQRESDILYRCLPAFTGNSLLRRHGVFCVVC